MNARCLDPGTVHSMKTQAFNGQEWRGTCSSCRAVPREPDAALLVQGEALRLGLGTARIPCRLGVLPVLARPTLIAGTLLLRRYHPLAPIALLAVMTAILVAVSYLKGEPPQWRWGDPRE